MWWLRPKGIRDIGHNIHKGEDLPPHVDPRDSSHFTPETWELST